MKRLLRRAYIGLRIRAGMLLHEVFVEAARLRLERARRDRGR